MNSASIPTDAGQRPSTRRIMGGIAFILGWALLHVVLFYALAVSGFLMDIFLALIKSIMFPGSGHAGTSSHEILGWESTLQTGLVLAGAAGLPGGLAMFMPTLRRMLRLGFWLLLLAGLACEVFAFSILVNNALQVPT